MEKHHAVAAAEDELLRVAQGPAGDGLDAPESPDDDGEDIEHEGQVYRIPLAIKGAFLMNADYTRKTQELAEHRRALEQARGDFERRQEGLHAAAEDRVRLAMLDEDLDELESIDWEALAAEEPQTAQALWARYQQLGEAREAYVQALSHREESGRLEAQRRLSDELQAAGQELSRDIQGWSPEVALKLVEFAAAFGVTADELRQTADPRLWKILHRAHLGDQMIKQQETAKQTAQAQAMRPAVRVSGGGANAGGVRDELGTGEWMRRRQEQATGRR